MNAAENPHRIVVVGGGAGGLKLVTRLGDRLGKRNKAHITLIDATLTHLWKPLLHEVAVGTLDSYEDDLDYLAHARTHYFHFRLGCMDGLDRAKQEITLAPVVDETGEEVIPRRTLSYDTLVIAVGSVSNDFGTPGVSEHCIYLDTREQADRVQRRLLNSYLHADAQQESLREGQLTIAIVGAGATGVELAAELYKAAQQMAFYGLDRIVPERDIKSVIIEAADTILPGLPNRLITPTEAELRRIGVQIYTGEQVVEATEQGIRTKSGRFIPAEIKIWCAGIKAPEFLRGLNGLETNRKNQLLVNQNLQVTRDENIFALGDCAACPQPGSDRPVPPRAQAAGQQAAVLAKSLVRRLDHQPLRNFVYRDYGSLISLSHNAVGNLMGNLLGSVMLEGRLARMAYISLYKRHQLSLHGLSWVSLMTLVNLLQRRTQPRLKLH